jgi:hypothetical protein
VVRFGSRILLYSTSTACAYVYDISLVWHCISYCVDYVIRISTRRTELSTIVAIDGQLVSADLEEVRGVWFSVGGPVVLDLGGLDACSEDGVELLREWVRGGARLRAAAPFLRMVLEGASGRAALPGSEPSRAPSQPQG